jgi:hypothetical protein
MQVQLHTASGMDKSAGASVLRECHEKPRKRTERGRFPIFFCRVPILKNHFPIFFFNAPMFFCGVPMFFFAVPIFFFGKLILKMGVPVRKSDASTGKILDCPTFRDDCPITGRYG